MITDIKEAQLYDDSIRFMTDEVNTDDDMSGIAPEEETEAENEEKIGVVTTPNNGPLNLRSDPDKKSATLITIPAGTKINYRTSFSSEWVIAEYNGFEGYCMAKYIK